MAGQLGALCRDARRAADPPVTMLAVAQAAGVSQSAISAFELGISWPRRIDEIVEAYEHELGLPDGEIWRRALDTSDG